MNKLLSRDHIAILIIIILLGLTINQRYKINRLEERIEYGLNESKQVELATNISQLEQEQKELKSLINEVEKYNASRFNEIEELYSNIEKDLISQGIKELYRSARSQNDKLIYNGLTETLFIDVLTNKVRFKNNFSDEILYFKDLNTGDYPLVPVSYSMVDMNGDNYPELIIGMNQPDFNLVLHRYKGKISGFLFSHKEMSNVKTDGTFFFSSGAADSGFGKLHFINDKCEIVKLFESVSGTNEDGEFSVTHYHNDMEISEKEFSQLFDEYLNKEDIIWYQFPTIGKSIFKQNAY